MRTLENIRIIGCLLAVLIVASIMSCFGKRVYLEDMYDHE